MNVNMSFVKGVVMYFRLFVVFLAASNFQVTIAQQRSSSRRSSATEVPMLIDEDENYVSETCSDSPRLPVLDITCLTQRVVKNNATYVWYYNSTASKCMEHVTADCPVVGPSQAPSKNRFSSWKDCVRTCQPGSSQKEATSGGRQQRNRQKDDVNRRSPAAAASQQPCSGLPVTGTCQASVPSWYYDRATDECAEFNYSGCGGNRNRFASRAECSKQCKGRRRGADGTTVNTNPRSGGSRAYARPADETSSSRTTTTTSGVSRTSTKRKNKGRTTTTTTRSGLSGSRCADPPVTGTCRGSTRRWYYDMIMADCYEFVYSGCGTGLNNFATRDACLRACNISPAATVRATDTRVTRGQNERGTGTSPPSSSSTQASPDVGARCTGRAVPGPCRAMMRRYYYSESERACRLFIYGGCGGSDNRFYTERECTNACVGR